MHAFVNFLANIRRNTALGKTLLKAIRCKDRTVGIGMIGATIDYNTSFEDNSFSLEN
jgi:hypothetical protein